MEWDRNTEWCSCSWLFSHWECLVQMPWTVGKKEYFTSPVEGVRYQTPALGLWGQSGLQDPTSPVVHCFRTAQWLLDHSNTSGIILAVHHYPEINNDCHALFCNSFLKSSFTIMKTHFYSFFLLIIFVWLDVTFHCMLISISCWTSEGVGTERL